MARPKPAIVFIFITLFLDIFGIGSIGGIGGAAIQSLISQSVPADEQGAVQGALNSIVSVSGIIAPLIWTRLFSWGVATRDTIHLVGLPFYGASLVSMMAAGTAWLAFRKAKAGPQAAAGGAPT